MPALIKITDDEIAYAEKILLPDGKCFDDERIAFIKNLETLDLQAVPGSGKTTTLLAKLLILERCLPFEDGSGILVLSHTNVAIDKIKNKIERHCPKLFSYPNFLGTIQSFVDQFLAIPCYAQWFKKRPYRIDNEIYDEVAEKKYSQLRPNSTASTWLSRQHEPLKCFKNIRFDTQLNLLDELNGRVLLKSENASTTYTKLKEIKWGILEQGFLHFDDAYFLGESLLVNSPRIKTLLQKRFRFVFVDEMQDMDKHQHDILEKIFFDDKHASSIYQRIGDKNQAIFDGGAKIADIWSKRDMVLLLRESHRLTQPIADLVNCFALETDENFRLVGLGNGNIKPHLIVYKNESIKEVIPTFAKKINDFVQNGLIKIDDGVTFKAIAWRKDVQSSSKIGLADYHADFKPEKHKPKVDHACLQSYLMACDTSKKEFKAIQDNIMNALLKILRSEEVTYTKDGKKRYFTAQSLYKYLKENHTEHHEKLKLYIYQWALGLINGDETTVLQQIQKKIPSFLNIFGKKVQSSKDFICGTAEAIPELTKDQESVNKYKSVDFGFEIDVTTIHAEKGQDHTATLYLETYYQGKGENAKAYESQRLCDQFKFKSLPSNEKGVYIKQSAKMMYVGCSRPTHLLCVAVQKENFEKYMSDIDQEKWEIIYI